KYHSHGNTGCTEYTTYHGRGKGMPQTCKGTHNHNLPTHKHLGIGNNLQIVHSHGSDRGVGNKNPENGYSTEVQQEGCKNTPSTHKGKSCKKALFHTVDISGTPVLRHKAVDCHRKSVRDYPANRFNLAAHLLHSNGIISKSGNHTGNYHGNKGEK